MPKKPKKAVKEADVSPEQEGGRAVFSQAAHVIVRPHVTEKAAVLTDRNVYTFVVEKNATKPQIAEAIRTLYKKTPVKITVTQKEGKRVMRRSGPGRKPGIKKAYVYLKKGDTLDIL